MSTAQEARAAGRNLAKVRQINVRIARLESFGGHEGLVEQLREQVSQRLIGRCKECHRTLTDPSSVAGGIGPECAQKAS